MDRSDEQEESMIEVQPQQPQAIEEIKLDNKEEKTIKLLKQMIEESDMDWERVEIHLQKRSKISKECIQQCLLYRTYSHFGYYYYCTF
ncbi:unnamed protein product (macronuclear) [Paramecium tetraurelia]|uniref:Uncharacterized protein n=1 Tax=Paramecium tetraurelia TaxID=5888 RepID=A0C540_PARTE|nr:uncharacterized protein GSPATT00006406001 [Paramecium tetraurelia]CAK65907.1 unnamed protein product [Paramecium tetraurelia]|eukprot:XP_001433304.1 hypothetical protein (macronuclear) [Paramecium tetraurelia strain d4-2]